MRVRAANPGRRRGAVLLIVLVVLTMGALAGTAALVVSDAERVAAHAELERVQARALAWSGVQAVMAELSSQRDAILAGEDPRVTGQWTVFEDGALGRGVFRVVAAGDGSGEGDDVWGSGGSWGSWGSDALVVSETAKLDVNRATREMLAELDLISEELADEIVRRRERRVFTGVEELLWVPGVTPELLYGWAGTEGAWVGDEGAEAGFESDAARGLIDVLTVFSFDPNVQAGLGRDGSRFRGNRRINLAVPWSRELEAAIGVRFGRMGADDFLRVARLAERSVDSSYRLVHLLGSWNVRPEVWDEVLDVFTTTADPYMLGRVDVTRASAEVLACIPGIDAAAAADIVAARRGLDAQILLGLTWLMRDGILDHGQFAEAVDHLTTRSMQWRVRVEGGFLPAEDAGEAELFGGNGDDRLRGRVVLDAVIDISSQRPRVAYLRDVTMMGPTRELEASLAAERGWDGFAEDALYAELAPWEPAELEGGGGFDDPAPMPGSGEPALRGGAEGRGRAPESRPSTPRGSSDRGGSARGGSARGGSGRGGGVDPGGGGRDSSDSGRGDMDVPQSGPDRRLGRWTIGPNEGAAR